MLLGLDYDLTYTRDPDFWDAVIALGASMGHKFVCVTQRAVPPGTAKVERVPNIPVVCAGEELKADAALAAGHVVHVWIDDDPSSVKKVIESAAA
jgi:hypothetical protein